MISASQEAQLAPSGHGVPKEPRQLHTVWWEDGRVRLIDQTRLPQELVILDCQTVQDVAAAIKEMRLRGAPAIGAAAAYGFALAAWTSQAETLEDLWRDLAGAGVALRATRPTARNLFWALERMWQRAEELWGRPIPEVKAGLQAEAEAIAAEDEQSNRQLGALGAQLVPERATILTHCNAGSLATVAYGTALGVIRAAHEQGKRLRVFVGETRPLLQGARLTTWELAQEGISTTLITDSMVGHFMKQGVIDLVLVGADRIAANGDVANKIGTYTIAVLAREHGVPFYVAAPTTTIDLGCPSGDEIPIEERRLEEVVAIGGTRIAPEGVDVANPAFDVTPNRYISAIITDRGILKPPFEMSIASAMEAGKS